LKSDIEAARIAGMCFREDVPKDRNADAREGAEEMNFLILLGMFGFLILTILVLELFWMWYPFLEERRRHRVLAHEMQSKPRLTPVSILSPVAASEASAEEKAESETHRQLAA